MTTREYNIEGLGGCQDCANKIEKAIADLPSVRSASLSAITGTLIVDTTEADNESSLIESMQKVARTVENVSITQKTAHQKPQKTVLIDKRKLAAMIAGAVLFLAALLLELAPWAKLALFLAAYLLAGGNVLLKAGKNILRGSVFDENFLMSIATIGAFAIGEYPEGVAVMLFYRIGELFEDMAVGRSRKSISALMDIRPDYANLKKDGQTLRVAPEAVAVGDMIVVKPGEKVPLDGIIEQGMTTLDTSALTGESLPRDAQPGSEALSGSINLSGLITIKVTKTFSESTVSKILELVQNAGSRKSRTENFITKFARYYTPVVVFTALALAVLPPLLIQDATFADWIGRALVFLIVSCPCALVVSIPLGFFGGIGGASKNGILIKGGNYLEALYNVDTVVFDKTGTLTHGTFKVTQISTQGTLTQDQLLFFAAHAESGSNHPIALSILKAYGKQPDAGAVSRIEETAGQGVSAMVNGKEVLAGNARLMEARGIAYTAADAQGTLMHIAVDGLYAGHIVIADTVKKDSAEAVRGLKALGVKNVVMLTGDNKAAADAVGDGLGLDAVYAELLPDQKVEALESIEAQKTGKGKLVFVGDGINDAPVLARADVGVAMGALGSDAAIEAADVVLMTDEPSKLVSAIRIAKRTRRIVWQNIILAMGVKGIVLLLGAGGIATMWEAVFADVGVALLAVLNAMRVLRIKNI